MTNGEGALFAKSSDRIRRLLATTSLTSHVDFANGEKNRILGRPEKPGHIYFVRRATGDIKIGYSADPKKRLQQLQCGSPEELSLLHMIQVDDMPIFEAAFHYGAMNYRITGEWFHVGPEYLSWVRSMHELDDMDEVFIATCSPYLLCSRQEVNKPLPETSHHRANPFKDYRALLWSNIDAQILAGFIETNSDHQDAEKGRACPTVPIT